MEDEMESLSGHSTRRSSLVVAWKHVSNPRQGARGRNTRMTYVFLASANELSQIIACLFALLPRQRHLRSVLQGYLPEEPTSYHAPVINFHAGRTMRRVRREFTG